jgi:hypothetical protein
MKKEKTEYEKGLEMVTYQLGFFVTALVLGLIIIIIKSLIK